jgi:hypothetical protein
MRFHAVKTSAPVAFDAGRIAKRSETRLPLGKLVGALIVAGVPALFWTGLLALISHITGLNISAGVLVMTGAGIALFLLVVYASIVSGSKKP